MQSTMHLYPVDGAAHDPAASDTAWSYRDATWATVYAGVDGDPANADAIRHWSVDYFEALHPYSAGGAYVNMMMDEARSGSARATATTTTGSPASRPATTPATSSGSTRTSSRRADDRRGGRGR